MANTIYIHKTIKRKDAVRVNSIQDIPEFLQGTITVEGESLKLVCVEGNETAPLGSVIGYEKSAQTETGWNTWVIGQPEKLLDEIDGVFYTKVVVLQARAVDDEFPEFLKGAQISHNDDGSWTIKTDWGESTGFPGKAYWVRYGTKEDGSPDANILTKSEKSYRDYIVCDEDGNDVGFLAEIDPA